MINYKNSSIIYISQEIGNDSYAGFLPQPDGIGNGPIKTIRRLERIINHMRGSGFMRPITVRFIGDFCLDKTIELGQKFDKKHIGNQFDITDITFESYGEKRARIIGGKILKGFKEDVFNGCKCISLHIPEVEYGSWRFTDLYINNTPAARTRYPKVGELKAVTTEFPRNNGDTFDCLFKGSKWFVADKKDLANINNVENAIVSFYHFWIDEHSPIENYDKDTGKITLSLRTRFNITTQYEDDITSDLHYFLENIPDTFGTPGEWYLDVERGMLYYTPKDGENLDNLEIIAPTVKHFANICGNHDNKVTGIRFRNLDFIATRGEYQSNAAHSGSGYADEYYASDIQSCRDAHGSLQFENADTCSIENCSITCAGTYAIDIYKGCEFIRVENCKMTNCGAGGVKIWGTAAENDDDIRPSGNCKIHNNIIKNCGIRYAAGCGIIVIHSSHNEISCNDISHLEYSGISIGWEWGYMKSSTYGNIINGNHIHHIGQGNLSDMGGIYLLGKQHGTIVANNVVHDIISKHYGAMGIYTDQGSSYITLENNIIYNCKSSCYQHHYGQFNTLRGNIFALSGGPLCDISLAENNMSTLCEENYFITKGSPVFVSQDERIPTDLCSSNNVFWDIETEQPIMFHTVDKDIYFKEWQGVCGFDYGSAVKKPDEKILKMINQ